MNHRSRLLLAAALISIVVASSFIAQRYYHFGDLFMTYPYASTDPAVTDFVTSQNNGPAGRGGTGPFVPALMNNGIAGSATDNVIGFSSLASSGTTAISMGTGFNTVVIDGYNSSSMAGSGAADNYSFTVDTTGLITLTDTTTSKTQQITGASFLVFDSAAIGADANGNPVYQQLFFIGNANQTEVTELYNAAFGRQPDLGGVEYYANQLKSGMSFQQIAAEFTASPEFQTRFGTNVSDAQFVQNLYQNVLHRTPSAAEAAYYTAALANAEAGSIVNTTNPVAWSREQELLNFTNSPENQADTAGFVINTAGTQTNGLVYSTPATGSETGAFAIAQASQTGNLDTTQISSGAATTTTFGHVPTTTGSISILGPAYTTTGALDANVVADYATSGTVTLSPTVPNIIALNNSSTIIVNGAATGGDYIGIASGTVNLHGTGNFVWEQSAGSQPTPTSTFTTINGFTTGNYLTFASNQGQPSIAFTFSSPSTSSPIQGGGKNGTVIYVGNVGGGTPTEVAAAASKVYIPADFGGEQAIFYGQTSSGGTAIYDWFNYTTAPAGADTHNDHTVHADNFAGGVILVGVAPSSITASTFHS